MVSTEEIRLSSESCAAVKDDDDCRTASSERTIKISLKVILFEWKDKTLKLT